MPRYSPPVLCTGEDLVRLVASLEVELWAQNRTVDPARAYALSEALARSEDPEFLGPCPVFIAVLPDGKKYLLDGQHRHAALARHSVPETFHLFIAHVQLAGAHELEAEFERINCGTPVPAEYWDKKVGRVAGDFLAALARRWPGAAAVADRPHRPRYNARRAWPSCASTRACATRSGTGA